MNLRGEPPRSTMTVHASLFTGHHPQRQSSARPSVQPHGAFATTRGRLTRGMRHQASNPAVASRVVAARVFATSQAAAAPTCAAAHANMTTTTTARLTDVQVRASVRVAPAQVLPRAGAAVRAARVMTRMSPFSRPSATARLQANKRRIILVVGATRSRISRRYAGASPG